MITRITTYYFQIELGLPEVEPDREIYDIAYEFIYARTHAPIKIIARHLWLNSEDATI